MRYYGSYRKLHGNSRAAMLAAIEIYNKPQMAYRDEVFVILLLNAWELLLKAMLSKEKRRIYYPKERGQPYRTLGWHDALRAVQREGLWPPEIPALAVDENLDLIADYRDQAVHFYNADGFGLVIFSLAQTNIVNYRDTARATFGDDLADAITWRLMPLGVQPPVGPLEYLKQPPTGEASPAVREFLDSLAMASGRLQDRDIDTGRLLTIYDVNLQSIKKVDRADFTMGVTGTATPSEPTFVNRKVDPRDSHPLFPKQVLQEVGQLHGKKFAQFHFTALERHYGWRESDHLCYDDEDANTVRWSREIVALIGKVPKKEYMAACKEFGRFREEQKRRKRRRGR